MLTAAVRLDGVLASACIACDRPTNAEFLGDNREEVGVPTLRPGDVVIMDNLSSHKSSRVARLIGAAGATLRFLPAYSPDLNLIEKMVSKAKTISRRLKARIFEASATLLGVALKAVEISDVRSWFGQAGYKSSPSSDSPDKKPI